MKNDTLGDICISHQQTVRRVQDKMPPAESLGDLADFFKVLGDQTRVKILQALSAEEMCVCCLAALLNMSSSAVSHQLRILRASKIVRYRKEGKHIYYSLDDLHVQNLIREGMDHVQEG